MLSNYIDKRVLNRMYLSDGCIAMQTAPSASTKRRWIAIRPHNRGSDGYAVTIFEIDSSILDNDYDWAEEEEYREDYFFGSEEALLNYLLGNNIDCSLFNYPWRVGYPLLG